MEEVMQRDMKELEKSREEKKENLPKAAVQGRRR
jgi:hypothetical protein